MILEVPFHADSETIRSCYKRLALKYHPDRHVTARDDVRATAAAKFQRIAAAFDVLSDPEKRAAYDSQGMPGVEALEFTHSSSASENVPNCGVRNPDTQEGFAPAGDGKARENAYRTYESVFGIPVKKVKSHPTQVHNMAAQRGGGSFDDLQRKRMEELWSQVSLVDAPKNKEETAPSGAEYPNSQGLPEPHSSRGRYSGQGWLH